MRIETWGGAEGREARRSSRKRQEGDVTIPQFIVVTEQGQTRVFNYSQPEILGLTGDLAKGWVPLPSPDLLALTCCHCETSLNIMAVSGCLSLE